MARPLSGLKDAELERVYSTIAQWMAWKKTTTLSSKMISAAIAYHADAAGPKSSKLGKQVETIRAEIESIKGVIDKESRKSAKNLSIPSRVSSAISLMLSVPLGFRGRITHGIQLWVANTFLRAV